jgi:hypothetical protein
MTSNVVDLQSRRPVRPTNSGPSPKFGTAFTSPEHGIDTIRLRWRDTGGPGWATALESAGGDDVRQSRSGGSFLQVGDAIVGAYDSTHAYVEARASALLYGREDHRLVGLDDAANVAESAAQHLAEVGIKVNPADARVGRLDATAGLAFEDPMEGLAMMRALLHTDLPWLKAGGEGIKRNSVETVYWRAAGRGRRVLRRTYDKGVESKLAPPGALIRDEAQVRFPKPKERWLHAVTPDDLRGFYTRRHLSRIMDPRTTTEVVVCNSGHAIEELRRLHGEGEITIRQTTSLCGFIAGTHDLVARSSRYRHLANLSRLGIEIDDAQPAPRRVSLGTYFHFLVDQWAA